VYKADCGSAFLGASSFLGLLLSFVVAAGACAAFFCCFSLNFSSFSFFLASFFN
jgi:hypothetical protein